MKLFEEINFMERLDQLIRLKATGTLYNLSQKLGLSKRQTSRKIKDMKEMDLEIDYCKKTRTYYYKKETFLKFKISALENGEERKIMGGENFLYLFDDFFSERQKMAT